jgi:glycine cleavage system aminomethyltransferase T
VGQDTDALADAVASGFGAMVRPEKEDFLGRQSLVRCSEKGTRQRLVGFRIAGEGIVPEEGLQIVQPAGAGGHDVIGWVSSSRFSATLGDRIGLCWLPSDRAEVPGTEFTIWREGALLTARVHHGAFYDPDGSRVTS